MSCGQSPHEHSFATEWSTDAENHWHAATCEHSDQVSEKGAHTFGEWVETTENKTRECSVCGYKEVSENCTHEFGEWVVTKGATEENRRSQDQARQGLGRFSRKRYLRGVG